jgi:hypothetical protein
VELCFIVMKPIEIEDRFINYRYGRIQFNTGDHIRVTNKGKCVNDRGWYLLVTINKCKKMFISYSDLDTMIQTGDICTVTGLEAEVSLLYHLLNKTLDDRNEHLFHVLAVKWKGLISILESSRKILKDIRYPVLE